ncbi:glycoside hydrolase family 97 protein [Pedobacter metabolipauper]|uniref:Glycosyl hydrolase family 97 n=1 Tax=Pedobacter metabolipauper TaxID=425513 RepID=A0A4R6SS74_9SPHI|nr:glycoside hydrolase family 97 protein [Pedobacter metabolipauper]TDQ06593.1 glycosyl hydrolase family 97 [Pedobacter metabolipauper]
MKKIITCLLSMAIAGNLMAQDVKPVVANLNKVKLEFKLDPEGKPVYAVYFDGKPVITNAALGFELVNDSAFSKHLELSNVEKADFDESWKPVWGEVSTIRNHYQQLTVHLRQKETPKRLINIVFRVFEDGVGFRYEFPKQPGLKYFVVAKELTQFNLTGDHKAFWIPGDYDTNEYQYTTSKLSQVDGWAVSEKATDIAVRVVPDQHAVATPLMLKSDNGLYINIHEAALVNYPAMQLHVNTHNFQLSASLVPDALGNKAYLHAPFNTPWRTIIVSDQAAAILNSKMILNLNEPSVIKNTEWIKPMKFVGVWWEMQTGKSTWSFANSLDTADAAGNLIANGTHGANTENVKRYIDFAAKNGIEGVLVEGWNTGWEDWFGNWKENIFDFTTPYPDFDVKGIAEYAKAKGVKMIMHNETSGSATTYERYLDTAFRYMNKYGYPAVKTGYVGKIIPRGEHHDGQWMVNHYERVAQKAADHQVMIDSHESNRPTGLHRTYPNWLASEAGRGNEYNAFSMGSAPDHETILPFTRLMGGPMDYTPGIFKLKGYAAGASDRQVHTTLAKQLALYVTLYSPLQMAADLPENYEAHLDAFQFIKEVPADWDDTKVIEAEPGDYITIARKAKGSANWFIGSITDENARTAKIPLSFLDKGKKYAVKVYSDAADADWEKNPEAYVIKEYKATSATVLKINIAKGGGAAITIQPLNNLRNVFH